MNVHIIPDHVFKSLQRTTRDYDSAFDTILKYASSLAVNDYGHPLPYVTELSLVGGEIVDLFTIKEHSQFCVRIKVFQDEREKAEYFKNESLTYNNKNHENQKSKDNFRWRSRP